MKTWLTEQTIQLSLAGISTARLDCLLLLEEVTKKSRSWLLAHTEYKLTTPQHLHLNELVKRRTKHEPLSYILGRAEFYGRTFRISPDTLQPRPETETMIEMFLNRLPSDVKISSVADIGTGSGAIAITIDLERRDLKVVATEISEKALRLARLNIKQHRASVQAFMGDLIKPLPFVPDVVLANLPYVPNSHTINQAAMHEPRLAIFGGQDGLDIYRQLFTQIGRQKPKLIFTESLPPQHKELATIAKKHGYELVATDDFIQMFQTTP